MKADILTLKSIFSKDIRYVIPTFQRPYVWTKDDQWEPLWIDLRNTAEWYLEELDKVGEDNLALAEERSRMHFLGAVVLQQQPTPLADIEVRHVIDGQQRLTTLQLLLDAAQEVFEHDGFEREARLLRRLVQNDTESSGSGDDILKVLPTLGDRDAFVAAMMNHLSVTSFEDSAIVQAHEFFKFQLREWLAQDSTLAHRRAHAVTTALLGLFQVVVIDLATADDANVIFETLNARGTPLLDSELIKNSILHSAQLQGHVGDSLYRTYWMPFDEGWWRQDKRQGRLVRPRIDVYLHYWLTMHRTEEVPSSEVFSTFRKSFVDTHVPVEPVLEEILNVSSSFRQLELTDDWSPEGTFLYRWRIMDAGSATPLLLWLFANRSACGADVVQSALTDIESYLVRRMTCRMTTKDYNHLFLELLSQLDQGEPAQAGSAVKTFLDSQSAESRMWPSDSQFIDALTTMPLYLLLTRARVRFLLEALEDAMRSPKAEEEHVKRNALTIEHVMPQSWQAAWPLPEGHSEEDDEARERMIQTLGNLTLLNDRLNPALSNGGWSYKRSGISEHSVLFLNKDILAQAGASSWDDDSIRARSRRLAQVAKGIWPRH